MATATTPIAVPATWKTTLQTNAQKAKAAVQNNDFTFFHVLGANGVTGGVDPLATLFTATDPVTADQAQKDLENLNTGTVGTLNAGFNNFATNTEKLKDDKTPDQPSWIKQIQDNGAKLKQQSNEAIDKSTDQAIATISALPPDAQDSAANFYQKGTQAVMNFVQNLTGALNNVLGKIADFFKGIWDAMENALNSVKDAASSAWHAITGIFGFSIVSKPASMALLSAPQTYQATISWPAETAVATAALGLDQLLNQVSRHDLVFLART